MHETESGDSCGKSEERETTQARRGGSLSPAESVHSECSAYANPVFHEDLLFLVFGNRLNYF
jgi:hypothetical protein